MTDSQKQPSWKPLDSIQRRVIGVLIEKAKTTPAGYPMTANAVTTGCNQKSNREPLMKLDSFDVEKALEELRTLGAVSEVDWMGRSLKYRHQGYDWFGVNRAELAVMAELLLRGAQSLGDLRSRAARMEPIADLAALKPLVDGLVQRGLMIELTPAGRGQVVSHKVYTDRELAELRTRYTGGGPRPPMGNEPTPSSTQQASASSEALALLNAAVEDLRTEIASIREEVRDLARRFESRD